MGKRNGKKIFFIFTANYSQAHVLEYFCLRDGQRITIKFFFSSLESANSYRVNISQPFGILFKLHPELNVPYVSEFQNVLSPAKELGLKNGDVLLEIDHRPLGDLKQELERLENQVLPFKARFKRKGGVI